MASETLFYFIFLFAVVALIVSAIFIYLTLRQARDMMAAGQNTTTMINYLLWAQGFVIGALILVLLAGTLGLASGVFLGEGHDSAGSWSSRTLLALLAFGALLALAGLAFDLIVVWFLGTTSNLSAYRYSVYGAIGAAIGSAFLVLSFFSFLSYRQVSIRAQQLLEAQAICGKGAALPPSHVVYVQTE